jgi:putative FmdB family regulatory protein
VPLYEYECRACGNRFEQIQKFSDPPVEVCPGCGARAVEKLLSSPAIQFKGSGWYITDYARKNAGGSSDAKPSDSGDGKEAKDSKNTKKTADTTSSTESGSSSTSSTSSEGGAKPSS